MVRSALVSLRYVGSGVLHLHRPICTEYIKGCWRLLLSPPRRLFPFLLTLLTSFLLCYLLSPPHGSPVLCSRHHISIRRCQVISAQCASSFLLFVLFVVVVAVVAGTRAPAPAPAAPSCSCSCSLLLHSFSLQSLQSACRPPVGGDNRSARRLRGGEHEGFLISVCRGFETLF